MPGWKAHSVTERLTPAVIAFTLILMVGVFARTWQFASLPPGLNQDEASIGVDAYDLGHYGIDRNGNSDPVLLVSWGSGQNALYAYVLIPFVYHSLTPLTVRLPMLISGILSLPLVFLAAKKIANVRFALLAMFFLAVSPWHILLSRWGLEANLLPFVFLIGFTCLLYSSPGNGWFVVGSVFMALSLYAYGTAYLAVPLFLVLAVPIFVVFKRATLRQVLAGGLAFLVLATPIGLYVLINTFHLNTLRLGAMTIPRLPARAQFEHMAAVFNPSPVRLMTRNFITTAKLLVHRSDGLIWNSVEPYGYFYPDAFPLAVLGGLLLIPLRRSKQVPERFSVLFWLAASLATGIMEPVDINRLNLIFIPLLLCTAAFASWLYEHLKPLFVVGMCALGVGFILFTRDYHGAAYRQKADQGFFTGLLPAVTFAIQEGDNPICETNQVHEPYIFALFADPMNPAGYLGTIQYVDPQAMFRVVKTLGRYAFGLDNCVAGPTTIYVLASEQPPGGGVGYTVRTFGNYRVYTP
ncbi:MAG: hypothetical protein ABSB61_02965 [Anaerolineales bacterium]|jgi:hypothetical protein